jgi:proteasome beta subunit
VVATVTESGYLRVADADLGAVAEQVEQERRRTHQARGGAR